MADKTTEQGAQPKGDSLLERVARAVCEYKQRPCPGAACEVCTTRARSAIAAMRDIPPLTIMHASKGGTIDITSNAGVFWRAIIDSELAS